MIVTLTLNPAIDKTVVIPGFRAGAVNRIQTLRTDVGGKGVNVSKCLKKLGCASLSVALWGGSTGKHAMEALKAMGITPLTVGVEGDTRTNLKIVDPEQGENTDINEPGPAIGRRQLEDLVDLLDRTVGEGDLLVISGSIPKSVDTGIYRDLVRRYRDQGASVYLDADGEAFLSGVQAAPDLVKPNQEELGRWAGKALETREDILEAARKLMALGVKEVVVSMGGDGALFIGRDRVFHSPGLKVPVQSTVGAGDSMVAALAYGQEKGLKADQRAKLAIAMGAASVMCTGTQPPEPDVIEKLYHQVILEEV